MPLPNLPTDELVGCAWLASIPGMSAGIVATQLPEATDKNGTAPAWVTTAPYLFVTVAVVGGDSDRLLPIKRPVLQVQCWARKPGSNRPPWGQANRGAEAIRYATVQRTGINRKLAITANGVAYPSASVQAAYIASAPRRIPGDAGDSACYQLDLGLQWITLGETTL